MASKKEPVDPDDAPLKRLGGGRWQTRDERFTIEPQSGTWVVVDAEQTDDFGMPLVRGPFPTLTSAKDAISGARSTEPATSPLAGRVERRQTVPAAKPTKKSDGGPAKATGSPAIVDEPSPRASPHPTHAKATKAKPTADEPSAEPGWMRDLALAERGRARRLIAKLDERGAEDSEGLVRRDLVGDVPSLAAHAIGRRLAALGDDASPGDVADVLADGRDEDLGVRWRLVDGDGRPILLEPRRLRH
jgi:hypothetical protein